MGRLEGKVCFARSPELCVEVISPAEIQEKMALYFDAGAREVWLHGLDGAMSFFAGVARRIPKSKLCSEFPQVIHLP